MTEIAYELECSVEAEASAAFAWKWRTDITNWVDPPAEFRLDGPFAAGSRGTTVLPGREPLRWEIRDVRPERSFIIDMPLDRATLSFEWRFDAVSDRRTKLTQHIVLSGENATDHAAQVQAAFGATLVDGMNRIATAMATAEAATRTSESSGLVVVEEGGLRVLEGSPDRQFLRRARMPRWW